jgi:hypothetical protein
MKYHEANGEIMYESESYRREIMASMAAIMYHGVIGGESQRKWQWRNQYGESQQPVKAK